MRGQGCRREGLWRAGVGVGLALVLSLAGWGQTVQVERPPGTVIPSGGTDAQGWQRAGAGQVLLTYTVRNTGGAQLDVTSIAASDLQNVTVGSISPTAFSLAPNGTQAVEVRYTPTTDGPFSFDLTITSNAPAYAWTVAGDGDATPPTVPTPLTPADGQWFNTTAVGFTWDPSTDGGSGVRDYRVLISGPVNRDYYTANTYYNPTGLVEGAYTWRLRARDWVGNASDYTAYRAFAIDLTPPVPPTLSSPSHTVGTPSNDPNVQIQATGASDPLSGGVSSGIGGFEVAWDQSPTWNPSQVTNRPAGWAGETLGATSNGSWWIHVATRDVAGNWATTLHFGPFQIDTDPPSVVSMAVDTNPMYEGDLTQQVTVTFSEPMNAAVHPTITFSAGTFTPGATGVWSNGNTVWTRTFTLTDNDEETTDVTVSVTSAQDAAGNTQVPYTSGGLFDIDTRKPRATVTTNRTPIAGGSPIYEGALSLTVTVTYDEDMNLATTPTVVLVGGGTNWTGPTNGQWIGSTVYRVQFTHNGTEETILGTALARVADGSGARDIAGNADVGADSPMFDIDTRKPRVTSIEVDHTTIVGGEPGKGPIYEGSRVLTVTVMYDEPMDTLSTPVGISLINGGDHWSGPINGAWTSATVYRVQFEHNGTEEEIPGGTYVSVDSGSGARDLAGNADMGHDSPMFDIDTRKPRATVSTNRTTVAGGSPIYEGALALTVTVNYDEDMNQLTTPTIVLVDAGTNWSGPTGGSWTDARTYVATFTHNGNEQTILGAAFARVADGSGARDLAGNADVGADSPVFDIDTRKPRATVSTNRTTVAGGSPIFEGALSLTVTVTYDEDMDPTTTPTVLLVGAGANWTGPTGSWTGARTYVATFIHSGTQQEIPGARARVLAGGARDLAGNTDVGADSDPFDIDTRKPRPTVTTDHYTIAQAYGNPARNPIYEGSLTLTVTVTYDEDMNPTTTPAISLVGAGANWTGPTGSWTGARTYVATFTHSGAPEEIAGARARVTAGGAKDLAGNTDLGANSPPFDIDTVKPTIVLIAASESGVCGLADYVLGTVCPPGAFAVTVTFSEAVIQGGGDALVLTVNLSDGTPGGTLAFAGISPHSTGAPAVWQSQGVARTHVIRDGDNACRLAVTEITGVVYDVAGNALLLPTVPLGSDHNITDRQDILVDTTRPVIHDLMFNTDASYTVRATDYYVDTCCATTVYFSAHVTDNCYVRPENVHVTVTLPTGNAILENVVVTRTPVAPNRVDITGSAVVRCLTSCPARVEVRVEARDCRSGPGCCGNWAIPQTTTPNEGLVWDTVLPIPRDDPRQDMVMDESAIVDPLVEVRRDDLGVYRLVVRENTPVRIDVLRNDADNCSCRCDAGPHPFDPCGPCASCSGCCAALFLHAIVDPPTYGTATIEDATGDCGGGTVIRYAPKLGYVGPDWFTYTIRDACGNVSSVLATVHLQVIPQLAIEDVFVVACAGSPTEFTVRAADLWVDYDAHDVPFRFTVVAGPEHGVVTGDPARQALAPYSTEVVGGQLVPTLTFVEATSITLVYVPAIGYTGADEIWIRLEDPFGAAQTARVALRVIPCEAAGVYWPAVTVGRGDFVPILPPPAFRRVADEARSSLAFLSLEDGRGYVQAASIVWSDLAQRPIVVLDTGRLPAGRYLLSLPLGEGQRVELVIVVKEKA